VLSNLLTHPIFTFFAGILVTLALIAWLFSAYAKPNGSKQKIADFHQQLTKQSASPPFASKVEEAAALERFKTFLQSIGDVEFIKRETLNVYSSDAYLDDTLTVHRGAAAIQDYFTETAQTIKSCTVTIDDVAQSGKNYYIRWTMVFSAPAMSGGEPVHSIGISQVCFDREGKVTFHQDFWDSGQNFYGHLPVVKGAIGYIQSRLQ